MIPNFEHFLYPILFLLRDGTPKKREELKNLCIEYMGFTNDELLEKISSGKKYKIVDRLQWATYYLLKSGLLCRPNKATDQITQEGIDLLNTGVTELNRQFLRDHYESFRLFEKQTRDAAKNRLIAKGVTNKKRKIESGNEINENSLFNDNKNIAELDIFFDSQNREKISNSLKTQSEFELKIAKIINEIEELNSDLIQELIGIINDFDSESFENLIKELLPLMGYSSVFEKFDSNIKLSHKVTASGLVNIDELGLSRFLFIAHNNITDEIKAIDVQSFMGYLSTSGLSKGVYITTSNFSEDALTVKNYGTVKVVLIDGLSLAKLMIKFNLGVFTRKTFEIKDVNQEYLFTHLSRS